MENFISGKDHCQSQHDNEIELIVPVQVTLVWSIKSEKNWQRSSGQRNRLSFLIRWVATILLQEDNRPLVAALTYGGLTVTPVASSFWSTSSQNQMPHSFTRSGLIVFALRSITGISRVSVLLNYRPTIDVGWILQMTPTHEFSNPIASSTSTALLRSAANIQSTPSSTSTRLRVDKAEVGMRTTPFT